jgi:23S rRNA (cytidine1920-2'-O)/16S rRNA (cytidine1409-2'-O)-methyltransferase
MKKQRIDLAMVALGLAESRSLAQRLVMAGQVRVNGQIIDKSSRTVNPADQIKVDHGPQFVSRGGEKLAGALSAFGVNPRGMICADIGASTGGFTDCLLQNGAIKVYAIDVGHGILHWSLRNDPRVVVMEKTNARYLEELPEKVDLVTIDASFISLKLLLPNAAEWLASSGELIALVKPQFEAGRKKVGRGGVVKDPGVHREVLHFAVQAAQDTSLVPHGLIQSPLIGPKGNIEFLLWCRPSVSDFDSTLRIEELIPLEDASLS